MRPKPLLSTIGLVACCRSVRRTLVAAMCVLISACDRSSPYTFGVVLDQDGMRGATMATEDINARGGINGHPLKLRNTVGAGSTEARLAIETAERLAADPAILAVIGHTNSSASLAASQVYNAQHVVQMAPTSSAPLYSHAGPYSFRLVDSDEHQAGFLADQVLARVPRPRIAVLFVNDDYGRPLHGMFVDRLRGGGVAPVYDTPYGENDTTADYSEVVAALARANPEMLVWIGRAYDFARVRDQIAQVLPNLEILASDGFSSTRLVHDSLHKLDGVTYVRLVDAHRADPALLRLVARYKREQWGEPSDQAVLSYDAVTLLAEAVMKVGPHRDAIREWLSRVGHEVAPVPALSGPIAFSVGGDRRTQYFLEHIGKSRLDSARALRVR